MNDVPSAADSAAAPLGAVPVAAPAPIHPAVWLALAVSLIVPVTSLFASGELGAFLLASWTVAPVVCLCVFAYLGIDRRWARWTAKGLLVVLIGLVAVLSWLVIVAAWSGTADEFFEDADAFVEVAYALGVIVVAAAVPVAAVPAIRRRYPGPRAFVLRVAIAFILPSIGVLFVPLAYLNEPPLLSLVAAEDDPTFGRGAEGSLRDSVYALYWTLPAALIAVGFGVRRTWTESLERLGLREPTRATYVTTLVATAALLAGAWAVETVVTWLWTRWGWPVTDLTVVEALFAYAATFTGAIVAGVTAGVGEEIVVRGVLQPRVGILLSNTLFTAAHAYQYHWDGLVQVFLIGLVLGVIRKRSDTTTTVLIHAAYDVAVFGAAALESS